MWSSRKAINLDLLWNNTKVLIWKLMSKAHGILDKKREELISTLRKMSQLFLLEQSSRSSLMSVSLFFFQHSSRIARAAHSFLLCWTERETGEERRRRVYPLKRYRWWEEKKGVRPNVRGKTCPGARRKYSPGLRLTNPSWPGRSQP